MASRFADLAGEEVPAVKPVSRFADLAGETEPVKSAGSRFADLAGGEAPAEPSPYDKKVEGFYKYLTGLPKEEFGSAMLDESLNLFNATDTVSRFWGKDAQDDIKAYTDAMRRAEADLKLNDPLAYLSIAKNVVRTGTEFAMLPAKAPIALKFGLQDLAQMPTAEESKMSWPDYISKKMKSAGKATLVGFGVGAGGKAIDYATKAAGIVNPLAKTAVRAGVMAPAFMGLTALEGGNKEQIIKSGITVLGFEATNLFSMGKPQEAIKLAKRYNPELAKVPDEQIVQALSKVETARVPETIQPPPAISDAGLRGEEKVLYRGTRQGNLVLGSEGGLWATDNIELAKTFGDKVETIPMPKNVLKADAPTLAKMAGETNFQDLTPDKYDSIRKKLLSQGYDAVNMGQGHMDNANDYWILGPPPLAPKELASDAFTTKQRSFETGLRSLKAELATVAKVSPNKEQRYFIDMLKEERQRLVDEMKEGKGDMVGGKPVIDTKWYNKRITQIDKDIAHREQVPADNPPSPAEGVTPAEAGREKYKIAGNTVDGRVVRKGEVPNTGSISASLNNYEELQGIREVPMSDFELTGQHYSVEGNKRIADLTEQIKNSKEITPLIVVVDKDGSYVLEGATRVDALYRLGAKSFPAKVIIDLDNPPPSFNPPSPAKATEAAVLYHGTNAKIDKFLPYEQIPEEYIDPYAHSMGIYTTDSIEQAKTFGDNIVQVAPPKKTFDITKAKTFEDFIGALPIDRQGNKFELNRLKEDSLWHGNIDMQYKLLEQLDKKYDVVNKLKEKGYDSIRFKESHQGKKGNTTVIFDRENTKIVPPSAPAEGATPSEAGRDILKDDTGNPLKVYHGTPSFGFDLKDIKGSDAHDGAIFFSNNRSVANDYANHSIWRHSTGETNKVYEANLEIKKPLVIDAQGTRNDNIPVPWSKWKPKVFGNLPKNAESARTIAVRAKKDGYDGVIIKNVIDTADIQDKTKSDIYVVFDKSQVKSSFNPPAPAEGGTTIPQQASNDIVPPKAESAAKTAVIASEPAITEKTSGIAASIEAKAVERGLLDKGYADLAGYDSSTIKAQSEIGAKYHIDQIKKIATGEEALPNEMKPGTALSIAEDYAMKTKDGFLMLQLAKSPLAKQISDAASEVSLSRMRDADAATSKIQEITKLKEKGAEKKLLGQKPEKVKDNIKKNMQDKIAKSKPNKYDLMKLLDSIVC